MLRDETSTASFTEFVAETEPVLRRVLTAAWGSERGREATAEALAYGWEHWERIREMENPAGYLYRVGRDRARRLPKATVVLRTSAELSISGFRGDLQHVDPDPLDRVKVPGPMPSRTTARQNHGAGHGLIRSKVAGTPSKDVISVSGVHS